MNINATYFDGFTSIAHEVKVELDSMRNGIVFIYSDSSIYWGFDELEFDQYDKVLEIRNMKHSGAILKISNIDFSNEFYSAMKLNKRVDIHSRLVKLGFNKILGVAILLLGLITLSYFYVLPVVAEKTASLLPLSFDDKIGSAFLETFLIENKVDSAKSKVLSQFANKLNLGNSKKLKFAVVESDLINAFALPNGQIIVYSRIIENMDSADQLAALLGHEVAHINNRHSTKLLCRNFAGYMVISLLLSDVNGVMAVVADNAQQLHSLSYSRNYEQEADEYGLKVLIKNQINPYAMVKLFEQLEEESEFSIPQLLSTHPLTKERKENLKNRIIKSKYTIKSNDGLDSIFIQLKSIETDDFSED